MVKTSSVIMLRCPFCGCEAYYAEDEKCPVCSTEMKEYTQCQCCGEFKVPANECEDFCCICKSTVHKKLYDFLKDLSEDEIYLLDETIDDRLEFFIRDYKEKNNGI